MSQRCQQCTHMRENPSGAIISTRLGVHKDQGKVGKWDKRRKTALGYSQVEGTLGVEALSA